jgi:hypothetical protein
VADPKGDDPNLRTQLPNIEGHFFLFIIMDIPTALIGLVGVLMIVCWLVAECLKTRRVIRIALGCCCIFLIGVAARHSHDADSYLQRQFLIAIKRELSAGREPKVRRALEIYETTYKSARSFAIAGATAAESMD